MSFRKSFAACILAGLGLSGCIEPATTSGPGPEPETSPIAARTAPPAAWSLLRWQSPIKDQDKRGTCYAFAAAAALEAFYKREHGLDLDLSEQYIFSMRRVSGIRSDYVTGESDGRDHYSSYSNNGGNESILQYLTKFRVPLERHAPYAPDEVALKNLIMPGRNLSTQEDVDDYEYDERNVPLEGRRKARYGATSYQRIADQPDPTDELEAAISGEHEVVATFKKEWAKNPTTGIYEYSSNSSAGHHVMLIIGYNRTVGLFQLKDSKGGSNTIWVTYEFVKKCFTGGTYITGVVDPELSYEHYGKWIGNWKLNSNGMKGTLVIRRFIALNGTSAQFGATKLGSYYQNGVRYEVNGYFEENGRKMIFYIADEAGIVAPGTLEGRKFIAYLHTRNADYASGKQDLLWGMGLVWQGLALTRESLPFEEARTNPHDRFEGFWTMYHDGWKGTLFIPSVPSLGGNFTGSYIEADGDTRIVSGSYDTDNKEFVRLNINFGASNPAQPFYLYCHPGTNRILSGTTTWNGSTYGALAHDME